MNDMTERNSLIEQSVLQAVSASISVEDLLATVAMTQRYRNPERCHIEAVYTFPVPLDATFLGLEAELDGKKLVGVVSARDAATETYEEAVTDGDAAILLEQAEPGLFTVNLGNLEPGEEATVTIRYAQLLRWDGFQVRLALPTVIAPRYGLATVDPHQIPLVDLTCEYPFDVAIRLSGQLARSDLTSPTHPIQTRSEGGEAFVRLAPGRHALDREFVLLAEHAPAARTGSLSAPDLDGTAIAVSLALDTESAVHEPRHYRVLLDCSGSMGGESIAQARQALDRIAGQLRRVDYFSLLRFGSVVHAPFPDATPATEGNIERLRAIARKLDADLGGTEMLRALDDTASLETPEGAATDILLITDGEVWADDGAVTRTVEAIRNAGARVFSVGVGSAVNDAFVRTIAERTGGSATFVTPGEDMAHQIERHFLRMATPRVGKLAVDWGTAIAREQLPDTLFSGDTAWIFATATGELPKTIKLTLMPVAGEPMQIEVPLAGRGADTASPSPLARVAARCWLGRQDSASTETAVAYQLLMGNTACVVVHERAESEKSDGLPDVRQVPQMLAKGYGATSLAAGMALDAAPAMLRSAPLPVSSLQDLDAFAGEPPTEAMPDESFSTPGDRVGAWARAILSTFDPRNFIDSVDFDRLDKEARDYLATIDGWDENDEAWLTALLVAAAADVLSKVDRWKHRRLRLIKKRWGEEAKVKAVHDLLSGSPDR